MTITHAFVSAKADGSDATLIKPSNWNDTHVEVAGSQPASDYVLVANSFTSVVNDDPLIIASGYRVDLPSGAVLSLDPDLGRDWSAMENTDLNQNLYVPCYGSKVLVGPYIIESGYVLALAANASMAVL